MQDVSGGLPVAVEGTEGRVYGMELELEQVHCAGQLTCLCACYTTACLFMSLVPYMHGVGCRRVRSCGS